MKQRAFTLAEVAITVSILGMLTAVAVPNIERMSIKAREARLKSELRTIREAIQRMYADTGRYPGTIGQLRSSVAPSSGTWGPESSPTAPSVVQGPAAGVDPALWRGPYLSRTIQIDPMFQDYPMGLSPLGNVHGEGYIYDGGLTSGAKHWLRASSSRISTEGTPYNTW